MADKKSRRTQNVEFSQEQNYVSGDPYAEASNRVLDDIDERVERAMRVYTAEEIMDLLICDAPGRSDSTEQWQDFLVLMRRAPPTRATQRGIAEAERELAYRKSRYADAGDEADEAFQRLLRNFVERFGTSQLTEAGACRPSRRRILIDDEPFDRDDDDAE
jgi:hypothetical protein